MVYSHSHKDMEKVRPSFRGLLFDLSFFMTPYHTLIFWQMVCGICFEDYSSNNMSAAACGHPFCVTCWKGLLVTN